MNTNAKPAKSGSRKKKCKCITERNVALSNGTKIYRDSLNAYSATKKGCASSASLATRKKRTKPVEWVEESLASDFTRYSQKSSPAWMIYDNRLESVLSATHNPNPTMKLEKDTKETIASLSGRRIRLSSLRPGDWLDVCGFTPGVIYQCHVVQNWPSLKRIELRWPDGKYEPARYDTITGDATDEVTYVGKGERRKWWKKLPSFLRRRIAEYSQP